MASSWGVRLAWLHDNSQARRVEGAARRNKLPAADPAAHAPHPSDSTHERERGRARTPPKCAVSHQGEATVCVLCPYSLERMSASGLAMTVAWESRVHTSDDSQGGPHNSYR